MYVHEQPVPGFGTVRIRPLDPVADARTIHPWVTAQRAEFWGMNGLTEPQITELYTHMATLDTHHAFLAELEGVPVALLQLYDPAADRVGACYDVAAGDAGVHVLLAPGERQPGWSGALLGAYAAYVFRTLGYRRVVVDPDPRNEKAVARFLRQGFTPGPVVTLPEVDLPDVHLPEKKAQLAFLTREVAFPG
ncbi:siderophore biosynthesis protein [Streptomyces sp. V2]|uniref:Lysine N-acyltransferase MbtK n=1 Tax=Streptomyces niveiscabiei TaxID=164115 RepID=A0ABW9HX64_9ACTN|nr:GNAT family N-acetyltransferase [Streptomyces sp. V2]PWG09265.1 siderophore biosynthesis protein [Streptomyces sp. V2]